ncbi:ScbA/BarX family gamma-butyrolactone biosynthesis protein [Streptomyces katsurahamanus]|uniref:Gamma-butyrolactone biosynthesis enzyme n=1 Tax=Streptomyces katsurahamanus TaxID=2577098 RepID=A0ABW9NQU3_9ACTN|nr:ScbA/BarX family gamma-butyrolactone biosynthesis protein [Streptomyces katsurahamanus]MQS35641.1 gamma-butyrolactone biosynthesis enzyme [Streptomyces katsurahamanus]
MQRTTRTAGSSTALDASRTTPVARAVSTGQPGPTTGQPGLTTGQPGLTTGQPGLSTGQPGPTTGQPGLTTGQPGLTTGQPGPTPGQPGLTTTVPREYVHRAAVSEVFLTRWEPGEPGGADCFTVTAQWPRGHALFTPSGGYQDPLLLAESVRQTGTLLAHAEYGVPFGHQFLMRSLSFSAAPDALTTGPTPTEVELRVTCHDMVHRAGRLAGMSYRVTLVRDGVRAATAEAAFSCASPSVYRRLRGERSTATTLPVPPGIPPAVVGRADPRDVVLAAAGPHHHRRHHHQWQFRVDTSHPILFDHPVDHVPGMALIESARQAAHAATGLPDALPVVLDSTFERYADLDAPCWIDAHPGEPDRTGRIPVSVRGTQRGATVFSATVVLRPHPDR